jgi:hypothetical protein
MLAKKMLLACMLCLAWASGAAACSIPVFRYALERWPADWYELAVFYRGELAAEDRQRLEELENRCLANGGEANLEVVRVNLDGKVDPDLRQLWESLGDVPTPYAVLRMPPGGKRLTVWSGPLSELASASLFDSPARRELARRLLSGDSVVWLVVGSKDSDAMAKLRRTLESSLPMLEEEILLPAGVGQPGSELASPIPLAIKFSVLAIDPADPAEELLGRIIASQTVKETQAGEPLATAVFGRSRAVDVFAGSEVTPELLTDVSQFLCGVCSCQVKQLNPGFDLLAVTLWEQHLFDSGEPPPPLEPAVDPNAPPVTVPIPEGPMPENEAPVSSTPAAASVEGSPTRPWALWTMVAGAAMAIGAILLAMRRHA